MELELSSLNLQVGESTGDFFRYSELFTPDDPELAKYGKLLISLELDEGVLEAEQIAEIILGTLRRTLYRNPELEAYDSFEAALQSINEQLAELSKHRGDLWVGHLHAVIGFLAGKNLYVTQTGEAQVYLLRKQHLSNISEGLGPESDELSPENTFLNISSGPLNKQDVIIFSSKDLLSTISEEALVDGLITADLSNEESVRKNVPTIDAVQLLIAEVTSLSSGDTELTAAIMQAAEEPGIKEPEELKRSFESPTEPTFWGKVLLGFESLILSPWKNRKMAEENSLRDKLDKLAEKHRQPKQSKAANTYELFKENTAKSLGKLFSARRPLMSAHPRNNSRLIVTVSVIIVLIGLSIWYWNWSATRAAKQGYETLITQIEEERNTAETRALYDLEGAKRLLIQVQNKVNQLKDSEFEEYRSQGDSEQLKLQGILDRVDNVYRDTNPTLAFDLKTKREDVKPTGLIPTASALYAYDQNSIYRLILDEINLRKVTVTGQENFDLQSGTFLTQDGSILLYTKDKQMVKYKDDNFSLIKAPAEGFKDAVAIADYDRRKMLYFLDPAANEVWRYSLENEAFDTPDKKNIGLDLSQAIDFDIDGAIYVLTRDSKILKIYGDEQMAFEISGLIQPFKDPNNIFVDQDENNGLVYILDAGNQRVVVLNKAGAYKAQYVFENLKDMIDLYVNYDEQMLYVLTSTGQIYKTPLKP